MSVRCHKKSGREYWYFIKINRGVERWTKADSEKDAYHIQALHDDELMREHELRDQFMNMTREQADEYLSHIEENTISYLDNKIEEMQRGI